MFDEKNIDTNKLAAVDSTNENLTIAIVEQGKEIIALKKELEIKTLNNRELEDNIGHIAELLNIDEGSVIDDVYDCIVNLKQDLEEYNDKLNKVVKERNKLIYENKAIKERCEYLQRSCDRKEEQRDDARREYMEQEDYKSRNEKAIGFLKNDENIIDLFSKHDFRRYPDYNVFENKSNEDIVCVELYGYQELLNILEGKDE